VAALTLGSYRRAQDAFEDALRSVPDGAWDTPSTCTEWTVADVAGHVVWGQEQLRHWATGATYAVRTGAPGAPHPAEMVGDDPVVRWRAARAAADATLTPAGLDRTVSLPGLGEVTVGGLFPLLVTDLLAHTWDIAHPFGREVRHDPGLIAGSFAWARDNVIRMPGFFGPELTAPGDTDEQARWLAYLGRAAWLPVPT
jgi:uncharacterized protein (TIGR03086 family)